MLHIVCSKIEQKIIKTNHKSKQKLMNQKLTPSIIC